MADAWNQAGKQRRNENEEAPLVNVSIFHGIFEDEALLTQLYSNSVSFRRPQGDAFQFEQAANILELTE